MDQGYKETVDLNKVDDEIKRVNVENQYIRSTLDILRKNIIIRDEKPRMEIKPPDILMDDQELIDLTTSVTKASEKFYGLEMELDNVYRKISQLTTTIAGIERNNNTVASKKNNAEAKARKPRNSQGQMTDQSPECLKLEKDLELITSTWMTMKEKERAHTTSQDCEQSKSAGTEGGDVDSLNDIEVLKDKISGLEILLAALEEYVTSDKQNSSLDVPSELQSGQKCVVEYARTKRIAQKFEKMKSELSAMDQENKNLKIDYDKNFQLFWTGYEELKTVKSGLEESLKEANAAQETLREEINSLQGVRSKLRQQVKTLNYEVKHLKDELEKKAQAAKEQEDKRAKYFDEKLQLCIKEVEVKSIKLETQAKEMEELRKAKDDALTSAQETLREEINSIQGVRSKLRRQVKTLKYEVKHMKDELEKTAQAAKEQEDELQVCIKELEVKSKKLETQAKEMEEFRNARDDALIRLSRLTGQKMSNGNPNITDLSDRNRPSKLGELYSKLYENEWTDAFEVLTEIFYLDDKSAIQLLLKILRESNKHASDMSQSKMKKMEGLLSGSSKEVSPDCKRLLREARKLVDIQKADGFLQDFQEELAFLERRYLREEKVIRYINSCFQLCWLMSIQDPPVVLSSDSLRGDKFDTNLYKCFTHSGDKVDYILWPALLLHKDGQLLAKGVAEPCTILRVKTL